MNAKAGAGSATLSTAAAAAQVVEKLLRARMGEKGATEAVAAARGRQVDLPGSSIGVRAGVGY